MRTITPRDSHPVPPEATRVFKGVIYDVYQWQQRMFDGSTGTFEMLKRPDTVEILAIKDGKLVMITDEQPGRKPILTFPAGRHDLAAETELECAKRELHEETGFVFSNWKLVDAYQVHAKIEQAVYIFVATGFERQDPQHVDAGGEKITVHEMAFAEVTKHAAQGKIHYWPELLRTVTSLDGLAALPEYK